MEDRVDGSTTLAKTQQDRSWPRVRLLGVISLGVIIMKVVIEVSGMCEMGPEEGFQKEGREGG